jgi:putative neutral zinc metallopeptidase
MRRNVLFMAGLAAALTVTACQDQEQKNDLTGPSLGKAKQQQQPHFTRGAKLRQLPPGVRVSDLADPGRVVVPTACDDNTPFVQYFLSRAFEIPLPSLFLLLDRFADAVPTFEALLFQTRDADTFFGYTGQYTHRMNKVERDVKQFWDIQSADIQVLAMHGTVLADPSRTIPTYESPVFLGLPAATAQTWAGEVQNVIQTEPTVNGGNHPLFTFNAFAISAPELGIPDKIVMGDGVLDAYAALGFDDVAPQAVFAHEFGHHIQFERNYLDELPAGADPATVDQAELTRHNELMADAFAGYYLTHKRGAALNKKRVAEFLEVFFQAGDCAFTNPGHHGTPAQRMRAAEFGFSVAGEAQKQGHILTAAQVHARFEAVYPSLVAP